MNAAREAALGQGHGGVDLDIVRPHCGTNQLGETREEVEEEEARLEKEDLREKKKNGEKELEEGQQWGEEQKDYWINSHLDSFPSHKNKNIKTNVTNVTRISRIYLRSIKFLAEVRGEDILLVSFCQ